MGHPRPLARQAFTCQADSSLRMSRAAAAVRTAPATPTWEELRRDELFRPVVHWGQDGTPVFRAFIGGQWRDATSDIIVHCPIDGSPVARVPQSGPEDVDAAVGAAHEARRAIRDLAGTRRLEMFEKAAGLVRDHHETFEEAILNEAGKPAHDRRGEVAAAAERLRATHLEASRIYGEYLPGDWAEDTVGKMALVIREPLGVVACIGPFNYPLFIPTAKITPALLAGNTVVAKGSHQTPISLLLFARVLEASGLPPSTLNVLSGSGPVVGEAMVSDPRVRMVSFTGSTAVGKRIHAIGGLKKYHLELGGKGHALVLEEADVALAAAKCVEGACKNAGQRCDAVSIAVVVRPLVDAFVEHAARAAQDWRVGDPRDASTRVGPLISVAAAERVEGLVHDAVERGAVLAAGGARRGAYFEPTVLRGVTHEMRVAREETFGPVLPVMEARDEDDALELATKTPYGLDSCVFTRGFQRMWRAAKRLQCGEVTLNDLPKHGVGHFPFGGQRESGLGREGIGYSIDEMTDLKTIVFTLLPKPGH